MSEIMSIDCHKSCLREMKREIEQDMGAINRLVVSHEKKKADALFLDYQIKEAESRGEVFFDCDRFMVGNRTENLGYFSQKSCDAGNGSAFYLTPDGNEVEVTEVTSSVPLSKWDDLVCVGMVVRYSRAGRMVRRLCFM